MLMPFGILKDVLLTNCQTKSTSRNINGFQVWSN